MCDNFLIKWTVFEEQPRCSTVYMSSSFWMLGVESSDFYQAEKEITACKVEQIHKFTPIFTQNDFQGLFWVKSKQFLSFSDER